MADKQVSDALWRLVDFAVQRGLVEREDVSFTLNTLLDIMHMDAPEDPPALSETPPTVTGLCDVLIRDAVARGLTEDTGGARERFGARLCGAITPAPALVRERFERLKREDADAALRWLFDMCRACDYIRVDHLSRIRYFRHDSPFGELEITINNAKPEKDPRDIARALQRKASGWPRCMLCPENPGYAGRDDFPARQNHRIVPVTLCGETWYLQYSPYQYYNEHCIVLSGAHTPMKTDRASLARMFDFVKQFPGYFIGSNADLPIVGGSILTHQHFQGGRHRFPMDAAPARILLTGDGVRACVPDWPIPCLRLFDEREETLLNIAVRVLNLWRGWDDARNGIVSHTDGQPHNAITPILRRDGGVYQLDLVLRNNRTSEEHPLGVFHPHSELHHIKKENIGLIEVMGLFILPGRLEREMEDVLAFLTGEREMNHTSPHEAWARDIARREGAPLAPDAAKRAIERGLCDVCVRVLTQAGVYRQTPQGDEGLLAFLKAAGFEPLPLNAAPAKSACHMPHAANVWVDNAKLA